MTNMIHARHISCHQIAPWEVEKATVGAQRAVRGVIDTALLGPVLDGEHEGAHARIDLAVLPQKPGVFQSERGCRP